MKLKFAVSAALLIISASTLASPHLTPAQCNDYPFKPLSHEVTHAQLMQELSELEAVGYQPNLDDYEYPSNLHEAEHRLQTEYAQDCVATPTLGVATN